MAIRSSVSEAERNVAQQTLQTTAKGSQCVFVCVCDADGQL